MCFGHRKGGGAIRGRWSSARRIRDGRLGVRRSGWRGSVTWQGHWTDPWEVVAGVGLVRGGGCGSLTWRLCVFLEWA